MSQWRQELDRDSFAYGIATAFCECVAAECKKCALSAPILAGDYPRQRQAMEEIAAQHGLKCYYDACLDLPERDRPSWWAFYKYEETIREYLALRESGLNPYLDIKPFFGVLSYGIAYSGAVPRDTQAPHSVSQDIMTGEE